MSLIHFLIISSCLATCEDEAIETKMTYIFGFFQSPNVVSFISVQENTMKGDGFFCFFAFFASLIGKL